MSGIPNIGPAHKFTGNGPGVIGADNCQICFKWHDDHAEWEATPPDMITAPGWSNPDVLAAAERRGIVRAVAECERIIGTLPSGDAVWQSGFLDGASACITAILTLSPSPPAETAEERQAKIVAWLQEEGKRKPPIDVWGNVALAIADAIERNEYDKETTDGR